MPAAYQLSVVIPAKNEASRLPSTLKLAQRALGRFAPFEIVVADDHSSDHTFHAATRAMLHAPLQWVRASQHRGAGAAVRAGVMAARGQRILVCDADGSVPFEDLHELWATLDAGFDIAAGSRHARAGSVEVKQPAHRVLMGHIWRTVVRKLGGCGVADTQCGFKLFRADVARALFADVRSNSFAFYVELLALARHRDLRVREVPVRWRNSPGSKIHVLRDPARMLAELIEHVWWPRLTGSGRWATRRLSVPRSEARAPQLTGCPCGDNHVPHQAP